MHATCVQFYSNKHKMQKILKRHGDAQTHNLPNIDFSHDFQNFVHYIKR